MKGNDAIYMGSDVRGGGLISISNTKKNYVVNIGSDKNNDDGFIQLYDRYGDVGWTKTGKR